MPSWIHRSLSRSPGDPYILASVIYKKRLPSCPLFGFVFVLLVPAYRIVDDADDDDFWRRRLSDSPLCCDWLLLSMCHYVVIELLKNHCLLRRRGPFDSPLCWEWLLLSICHYVAMKTDDEKRIESTASLVSAVRPKSFGMVSNQFFVLVLIFLIIYKTKSPSKVSSSQIVAKCLFLLVVDLVGCRGLWHLFLRSRGSG